MVIYPGNRLVDEEDILSRERQSSSVKYVFRMIARKWEILLWELRKKADVQMMGNNDMRRKKEINGFIWLLDECMR